MKVWSSAHLLRQPKECSCLVCSVWRDTYLSYPVAWYERFWLVYAFSFIVGLGLLGLQMLLGLYPNIWLSVLGLAFYFGGSLVDDIGTYVAHKAKSQFDAKSLHFPLGEANPLLPLNPKGRDLIFNWSSLLLLLLTPVVFFVPGGGVMVGIARFCAGLSNLRARKRVLLALDGAQEIRSGRAEEVRVVLSRRASLA